MKDEDLSLAGLLRETRNLVAFHQQCGLEYPLSTALKHFLAESPPPGLKQKTPPRPRSAPVSHSLAATPARGHRSPQPAVRVPETTLEDFRQGLEDCHHCGLGKSGKRMIFGEGAAQPGLALMIICDPPGPEEMAAQTPISGESRDLLVKMLSAINLSLSDVFITNVVKCAASGQSAPTPEEIAACLPFLMRQIELLQPKIICAMGLAASQILLKTSQILGSLRGRFHDFKGIPLLPTFHPAMLIKLPELKKGSWLDLQLIQKKLKTHH